ncbi:MAG: PPC domain-containing DNA-binding protein [Fidelibacterota bacterium]
MQYQQFKDQYFVYIEQDEPVMATLTRLCRDHDIQNGQISGIGAVKNIEIGAYDLPTKSYVKKRFSGVHELLSCQGNITLLDETPFLHIHLVLGDHSMAAIGGHLFEMEIAAVGEFVLKKFTGNAFRQLDENIGLATWCLEHRGEK